MAVRRAADAVPAEAVAPNVLATVEHRRRRGAGWKFLASRNLVIGGAMIVFALFYIGLTAGESLADRGILSPAVAMWWPNIVLLSVGLIGLVGVNQETGSTRGGDLGDLLDSVKRRLGLRPRARRA